MSLSDIHQVIDTMNRPLANFTPSIWGDYFLAYATKYSMEMDNTKVIDTIIALKKEVKKMFVGVDAIQNTRDVLDLIDAIQRLGVAFHFETEIEAILQKLHNNILDNQVNDIDGDLYTVALCFRLLRQQGHNIPCAHMFKKFKDNEGKFKESLVDDIQGMLSLYEASHLRGHGEEILDEALIFTTTHLKSLASNNLSSPLSKQINHFLKHPIRKSMPRREARHYLSIYEQDESHSKALLALAKLDFNQLQLLYKKELAELTRWWMEFDSRTKLLSFSRDRIVECFYWAMGVFYEAKHSLIRTTIAKLVAVLTIIDDIYDSFGTLPELQIFTEAIERWDISVTDKLPEYMKLSYKATLEFYNEVQENVAKGRSYCIDYTKKALLRQVRGYFHEAKWLHNKEIPTFDEYLPVGYENAGSFSLIAMSFTGMANDVTKEAMDWVVSDPEPKIVRAMSIVGRLMNDIAYHKSVYRKSGRIVASAMECYIKQYGATDEEAENELTKKVVDAWKDVNEECLKPTIPRPLMMRVLDLVRTSDEMYRDGDGFTQDLLIKDMIDSLIINPVPV